MREADRSKPGSDEDLAARRQRATLIRSALTQLPDEQRRVLALVYLGDCTQAEVAAGTAVPLSTVSANLAQGMLRLVTLVEAEVKANVEATAAARA